MNHSHRNLVNFILSVWCAVLLTALATLTACSGGAPAVIESVLTPVATASNTIAPTLSPTSTPTFTRTTTPTLSPLPTRTPTTTPTLTTTPSPPPTLTPSPVPPTVTPTATDVPPPSTPAPTATFAPPPQPPAQLFAPTGPAQPDHSHPCPGCPQAHGYITGRVVDIAGNPLPGVRLLCYNDWHRYPVVASKVGGEYDFPILQAEAVWFVVVVDENDQSLSAEAPVSFNPQEACWYRLDWQRKD